MSEEEFIVRDAGATPARFVRLQARNATAARAIAAELLDAWPGELEVWTTHYYTERHGPVPDDAIRVLGAGPAAVCIAGSLVSST